MYCYKKAVHPFGLPIPADMMVPRTHSGNCEFCVFLSYPKTVPDILLPIVFFLLNN